MLTQYQTEHFEGAGFIFMTEDMDILLLKDVTSGKWGMCKGHREPDEDHYLDTASREAKEELGLDADDYEITSNPFVFEGSPKIYIFHYAILKKPIEELVLKFDEVSEIKFIAIDQLMEQDGNRDYNIYVRLMIANATGTYRKPKPKPVVKSYSGWIPSYMRDKAFIPIIHEDEDMIESLPALNMSVIRHSPSLKSPIPSPICGASIMRPSSRGSPFTIGRAH